MAVFGTPLLALLPILVYWLRSRFSARRVDSDSRRVVYAEAKQTIVGALFFVAMLLYPQLSASILSALRCRSLGEESAFLEADYSVSCNSEQYSAYKMLAFVLEDCRKIILICLLLRHVSVQAEETWSHTEAT